MFKALFITTFNRHKRMLLGISIGLFSFQILMGSMYDSFAPLFAGQGMGSASMPEALGVFTGGANMFEPLGWFGVGYAHPIPIMLVVTWALVTSANSIAKEVEDGTAELLFTRPVPRSTVLTSRIVHFLFGLSVILGVSYLGSLAGLGFSDTLAEQVDLLDILKMALSYIPVAALIAGLGFFISSTASQRSTVTASLLGFTVISYFLNFAGQLWDALKNVVDYSIFYQTVPANWALDDINTVPIIITSLISVSLVVGSYFMLNRRNIAA